MFLCGYKQFFDSLCWVSKVGPWNTKNFINFCFCDTIKSFLNLFYWMFQVGIFPTAIFFYRDFLSQTLAIHRTAGEGRGPSFIPLCHFHLLRNLQTFICNFACEMTIAHFYLHPRYFPDCCLMRFTTLLNYHLSDWWCNVNFFVCLLHDLILGFCYSNLTRETVAFELTLTLTLVLQANRLNFLSIQIQIFFTRNSYSNIKIRWLTHAQKKNLSLLWVDMKQ